VAPPENDPIAEDAALDLEDLRDSVIFEKEERPHAQTSKAAANAAMDRYAAGDDAAFAELYDLIAPKLRGYCCARRTTRPRRRSASADDAAAAQSSRDLPQRGEVLPWAFAIARRLLINSYRRRQREDSGRKKASFMGAGEAEGPSSTDDVLHSKRLIRTIETELSRLPEAQRVAIELIKKEGLSLREVAEVLGTTSSAIKSRVHRAYETLRAALGDRLDEEERPRTT